MLITVASESPPFLPPLSPFPCLFCSFSSSPCFSLLFLPHPSNFFSWAWWGFNGDHKSGNVAFLFVFYAFITGKLISLTFPLVSRGLISITSSSLSSVVNHQIQPWGKVIWMPFISASVPRWSKTRGLRSFTSTYSIKGLNLQDPECSELPMTSLGIMSPQHRGVVQHLPAWHSLHQALLH